VQRLIEGADGVYICDECVLLGAEILSEEGLMQVTKGGVAKAAPANAPRTIPSPRAIVQHLDQYVIGQQRATTTSASSAAPPPKPARSRRWKMCPARSN
jgi:ATP-dependent Clp protease ATP-binding subunit ClpX